jgi:hypothetical protein
MLDLKAGRWVYRREMRPADIDTGKPRSRRVSPDPDPVNRPSIAQEMPVLLLRRSFARHWNSLDEHPG